jgi:hypothetical protein
MSAKRLLVTAIHLSSYFLYPSRVIFQEERPRIIFVKEAAMLDFSYLTKQTGITGSVLRETPDDVSAYQTALTLFDRVHRSACTVALFNRLLRRPVCLADLDAYKAALVMNGCHYAGLQPVSISQIIGSEGRKLRFRPQLSPTAILYGRTLGEYLHVDAHAYTAACG